MFGSPRQPTGCRLPRRTRSAAERGRDGGPVTSHEQNQERRAEQEQALPVQPLQRRRRDLCAPSPGTYPDPFMPAEHYNGVDLVNRFTYVDDDGAPSAWYMSLYAVS